ncbi:adenosylcobyric acid synthase [Salibacterium salarium]|uniref:cobyric acid synthase n=1 Tax=Salibacterium salarium TaxID=284579 RepID=UPI00278465D0|nr:cobyric acid synthase [Salibacterium salarium]MDQ0299487.1 adenosylcobyric acid synthase [Salibacterium salarium]
MIKGLMIWGTTSDAGKSYLVTGLCRALSNRGYKVAPFKGQNMSNNSFVTDSGHEIGRAQGLQAKAARVEATVHMNPVLLKPRGDSTAEVIIHGESLGSPQAMEYRQDFFGKASSAVEKSLSILEQSYDLVIMEGAGSPVEVNLMDKDIANLVTASMTNVPALLIADIEKGGLFASVIGTLNLLPHPHRDRVKGLIVNQFRGDRRLFKDGELWLKKRTGLPVHGILPKLDIRIEGEDSLSFSAIEFSSVSTEPSIDIAVIALPYVSNYTDIEPFSAEPDVSVRIVRNSNEFGFPDAVILPGSRSTIHDYLYLLEKGLISKIISFYEMEKGYVVGICGGFQMLGEELKDNEGHDSKKSGTVVKGASLFPARTYFMDNKKTTQWNGYFITEDSSRYPISGFEIHTGQTDCNNQTACIPLFYDEYGEPEGLRSSDYRLIGTYIHHHFYNDKWRSHWLNQIRLSKKLKRKDPIPFKDSKNEQLDKLADTFETYLDLDEIIRVMERAKK